MTGPEIIGLAIASAALSAGAGTFTAVSQNQAVKRQQSAVRRAAKVQQTQMAAAAELEREKRFQEARQVQARIRVASGESGLGIGGTTAALIRQADIDRAANEEIARKNLAMNLENVQSQAQATIAGLGGNLVNPIIQGVRGGIGGFDTGLRIGGSIRSLLKEPAGELLKEPAGETK